MSATAIKKLRSRWEKLVFARVDRTIARIPEDVLTIYVLKDIVGGFPNYEMTDATRLTDLPIEARKTARISWRHFYGFAQGTYFHLDGYNELDVDINLTLDFGGSGNHRSGYDERPDDGEIICGEVIETGKGKRFRKWFRPDPAFMRLHSLIMGSAILNEKEIAHELMTDGHPDKYLAIAELVLWDNVQPFVDSLKGSDSRPEHPAHGKPYGKHGQVVSHRGLWINSKSGSFVHTISMMLDEPKWWEDFQRLAKEQLQGYIHGGRREECPACNEEDRQQFPTR